MDQFDFDADTYGAIMDHCLTDPLFVRYQRERLELIYEHLTTADGSPWLEARFDPLKKRGKLTVRTRDGKRVVETEVKAWH